VDSVARNHPSNCDYFRTSVIFKVPDNLVFVGDTKHFGPAKKSFVYSRYLMLRFSGAAYPRTTTRDCAIIAI
jgi:hypothetical protein